MMFFYGDKMKFIEFFGNTIILFLILISVLFAVIEKKNVLELFLEGVTQAHKIVIELFPTLLALVVSVGMLNYSGLIDLFTKLLSPLFYLLKIDKELAPLVLVRPISGSTTTAVATKLMEQYGVDSKIGLITSCIMGSTETTIYVASIYSSKIKIKDVKEVIIIGLIADFISIITSCLVFRLGWMKI